MKRQPKFITEAPAYEWIERSPRRWIFFGKQDHFWSLFPPPADDEGMFTPVVLSRKEITRVSPERYSELVVMQHAAPCRLGEKYMSEHPGGWHKFLLYWYRDKWYYIAEEFGPADLIPLINKYHDDVRAAKAEKVQKRGLAIQELKRQVRRNTKA